MIRLEPERRQSERIGSSPLQGQKIHSPSSQNFRSTEGVGGLRYTLVVTPTRDLTFDGRSPVFVVVSLRRESCTWLCVYVGVCVCVCGEVVITVTQLSIDIDMLSFLGTLKRLQRELLSNEGKMSTVCRSNGPNRA